MLKRYLGRTLIGFVLQEDWIAYLEDSYGPLMGRAYSCPIFLGRK
jgi:hypothetical protein